MYCYHCACGTLSKYCILLIYTLPFLYSGFTTSLVPSPIKLYVDLNDAAYDLLYTQSRKSDFCFYNPANLSFLSPRQYHIWFNSLWFEKSRAYRELTGEPLPPLTPHKLRHTFASLLVSGGADVKTVADLLGHSNVDITNRYLHSYDEDRKNAVALIKM